MKVPYEHDNQTGGSMELMIAHYAQGLAAVLMVVCICMYFKYESRGKTTVITTTERRQVSYGHWEVTEDVKVHTDIDPLDAKKKKYWGFGLCVMFAICGCLIVMFPK
jgi:hypothetical protein